jgi:hypothetical protein
VLATLSTERTDGLLADGEPMASALNSGYHLAYVIGVGLVAVAIVVAVVVLQPEDKAAEQLGEQEEEHERPATEPAYSEA